MELTKLIKMQEIPEQYLDDIKKILSEPTSMHFRKRGDYSCMIFDCINYGIIIGKRLEREKHRRNK